MKDFVNEYYSMPQYDALEGFDRERAQKKAFSLVLPFILEKELTEKQNLCFRYKYVMGKTQQEIAELLNLSQPTVSRHISAAKSIVNKELKYCYAALSAALNEYDR